MAVLIRQRIRAVVFNQSSQWQRLWCSRGDCDDDDDSCLRGKHWKYTCTLICAVWSRAYSAMSVLRAAFWGEKCRAERRGDFRAAWTQRAAQTCCWHSPNWEIQLNNTVIETWNLILPGYLVTVIFWYGFNVVNSLFLFSRVNSPRKKKSVIIYSLSCK